MTCLGGKEFAASVHAFTAMMRTESVSSPLRERKDFSKLSPAPLAAKDLNMPWDRKME